VVEGRCTWGNRALREEEGGDGCEIEIEKSSTKEKERKAKERRRDSLEPSGLKLRKGTSKSRERSAQVPM